MSHPMTPVEDELIVRDFRILNICAVGGCANTATHEALAPVRVDGQAGELEISLCDEHEIEPWS